MKRQIALASILCAAVAGAADIYTVTETIHSGGIDLTALGDGYRQDAIAGQAAGANLPVAVTGRVVHASGLTADHPFMVSNTVAGSFFILKDARLVGEVPLLVAGTDTTYFPGTTLTVGPETADGMFRSKGTAQIDNLIISGNPNPATMYMTNSTFYVLNNTYLGYNGGSGTLYANTTGLGRTNSGTGGVYPWLGNRESSKLYFGYSANKSNGFTSGKMHLTGNAYLSAWHVYFGSNQNGTPPDDGEEHYAGELILEGGFLVMLNSHVYGSTDSIIRFRGGNLRSHGWGTYIKFEDNSSANIICQGENGKPIDLYMNKFANFVVWGSGSTGHLIMRGASDVYLYGGDGQGTSRTYTLADGGSYTDSAGGMYITDPDHRIDWLQTGGLRFRYSSQVVKILSSYLWPSNSWNGGVTIESNSKFYVNLLGSAQACNSLLGGGNLTNGVLTRASTIYIGAHGNDCEFNATLRDGGAIDIVKRGTGAITLKKPIPYTFTLEEGSAIIPPSSTFTTPGSLVTAEGTEIVLPGSTFAPPADYDMNVASTASFTLDGGGVLVVGGDGADQTVDFSKIAGLGSGTLRKVGANTVTLVNASGFSGAFEVEDGTLALAASAGTFSLGSVSVASGATLSVADGVRVSTSSLIVRGVTGTVGTTYGGADGATAIDGIAGAGSVVVVPASVTWTGAVDDDPDNLDNWTGLSDADALLTGLLTVNFSSSDAAGAWNVAKAYVFKGMNFDAGVTAFTFNKSSEAAKISVGAGGIVIADNRAAAIPFEFKTPVDFTAHWVTLDFGSNVVARFRAPLGGVANAAQTVAKVGGGNIYLYSTNSTYDGSMAISNGCVYAYGNEPFGPVDAEGTSKVYVDGFKSAKVYLSNVFTTKNFQLHNDSTYRTSLYSLANTTNTIVGNVRCGSVCKVDIAADSVLNLDGGYGTSATAGSEYVNWSGSGFAVFRDKPLYCGTVEASIQNIHLLCAGNVIDHIFGWSDPSKGGDPYQCWSGNLKFGADRALDSTSNYIFVNGTTDLNGTEQRFGAYRCIGTLKSLNAPGTLRLACATGKSIRNGYGNLNTVTPSSGNFVGFVNLVVEANDGFTFGITNRAISATGNVEVASGTLKFCGTASWLGATNVTVSGGTLVVPHSQVFGRYTDVHLAAGALQLDAGVSQKIRYLYLDGSETHARNGRYGALGNTSVPAANRTARITGPGVLNVLGEHMGTLMIFR
ncbi:MAG: hypothetical protein IJL17_17550 [Kiritimatiellae bacterium]|nr:hypothetical protein [Kiritimatiellia bacterium]